MMTTRAMEFGDHAEANYHMADNRGSIAAALVSIADSLVSIADSLVRIERYVDEAGVRVYARGGSEASTRLIDARESGEPYHDNEHRICWCGHLNGPSTEGHRK